MRNVEIKAKIRDMVKILAKAKELSGSEGVSIPQHDTFYKAPLGRLKLRRFETGNAELIYYDRPDAEGPSLSQFELHDVQAPNVNSLNNVLSKALGTIGDVKKIRQLFIVGQTRIHVDKVENLGDFMELEVVLKQEQTLEDGQKIADDLMSKLEIEKEDLLSCAYTDLLNK
ncbi:PREDICTED: uncharacterized protein LOC108556418 [Nicrophorus vespilloides]|uniref:Uncharacterized protein LOC108556418 n=1 Tax=Nicrophorus vespilloides TaxID=110193 RepID=A0ABM1M0C8_NICVS|nr:PREDICTED: uncharacterized protein LOC108556418 [Nicrophorus vespilloides]